MDIRSATNIAGAAGEPRLVARDSASSGTSSSASTTDVSSESRPGPAAETQRAGSSGQFYVSPFLTFDSRSLTVIFQVRDTESGDVTRQFPAESVVERYRRDPSSRPFVLPEPEAREQEQAGPPPPTIGGPVTEALREQETATPTTGAGDPASPGTTAPDTGAPAAGERAVGTSGQSGSPAAAPPVRTGIDLVA